MSTPNILDLEQVRACGRVPARPVRMDHAVRAWALAPGEAAREAERYAAMASRLEGGADGPWTPVWRAVAAVNRQRAAIYAAAARRRLDRGRVA